MPRIEFLNCLKVVSRKVPSGLRRQASLWKGILKCKTAKIFVSRLLELSLQKIRCKSLYTFYFYISELLCNVYQVFMNTLRKGASPDLLQRWDQKVSLKHIQSARQENYLLCVWPKLNSKITLVISLRDLFPRRHAVAADKNFILINTQESRFSKSTEGIKLKNISFERLKKAQDR